MSDNRMKDLMADTLERVKRMVDVDTAIGTPIHAPDGTMVVPVCRVTMGMGAGGGDFTAKNTANVNFGAGVGTGVTVTPVCFLILSPTEGARVVGINAQASTTADRLVEMLPDAVNKVQGIVSNFVGDKSEPIAPAPVAE